MIYRITLTLEDRKAIDWVGGRDWNGYNLFKALFVHSVTTPDDADWDDERDIVCSVPEDVAWRIREFYDDNGENIPHFAEPLRQKLQTFLDKII